LYARMIDEFKLLNLRINSMVKLIEQVINSQKELLRLLSENYGFGSFAETRVVPDVMTLLSLPSSLRKTVLALYKLGEATAEDLSNETKRLRAVESTCASQLARMGYLKKKRVGRKVYFYIENHFSGALGKREK